jgi:hypothetical protein
MRQCADGMPKVLDSAWRVKLDIMAPLTLLRVEGRYSSRTGTYRYAAHNPAVCRTDA